MPPCAIRVEQPVYVSVFVPHCIWRIVRRHQPLVFAGYELEPLTPAKKTRRVPTPSQHALPFKHRGLHHPSLYANRLLPPVEIARQIHFVPRWIDIAAVFQRQYEGDLAHLVVEKVTVGQASREPRSGRQRVGSWAVFPERESRRNTTGPIAIELDDPG